MGLLGLEEEWAYLNHAEGQTEDLGLKFKSSVLLALFRVASIYGRG